MKQNVYSKHAHENGTDQFPEKKKFIEWIKAHKVHLLFAGVSISILLTTILSIKNKDSLTALWESLKEKIDNVALYSQKRFEDASLDELCDARNIVQQDYCNPEFDDDYRKQCWNLLLRFNSAIRKKQWQGKEYGYPVASEHGWHLQSD